MTLTAPRVQLDTNFNPIAKHGRGTNERPEGGILVSGRIPRALEGTLFRNGPGLSRRGGSTKRTLLDGDGVMPRLELVDGRARYTRRFARTPKFVVE